MKNQIKSWNRFKRAGTTVAVMIVLFVPLSLLYLQRLETQRLQIDEWAFIRKSFYYDLFFVKRDWKDSRWYISKMDDGDDPEQPKIGSYIFGITLHLAGITDIEKSLDDVGFYRIEPGGARWWISWWNKPLINPPPELIPKLQFIWEGRRTAVFFSLLSFLFLFLFGMKMNGLFYSVVAVVLLSFNHLMMISGRFAMTDSMQLAFFFANLLLTVHYVKAVENNQRKKVFLLSLALGIKASLGAGVKVSGMLIVVFLVILSLFLLLVHRQRRTITRLLCSGTLIMTVGFLSVFIFFHPYLHQNTLKHFVSLFANRLSAAHDFRLLYPNSAIYSREDAAERILRVTLLPKSPYVNFRFKVLPIDLLLFLMGLWLIGKKSREVFSKTRKISPELIVIIWTFVVIGSLFLYLRNDWPRYYLPSVAVITIIQAYAMTFLFRAIVTALTLVSKRVSKQLQ